MLIFYLAFSIFSSSFFQTTVKLGFIPVVHCCNGKFPGALCDGGGYVLSLGSNCGLGKLAKHIHDGFFAGGP